jgi:hypothetical protein
VFRQVVVFIAAVNEAVKDLAKPQLSACGDTVQFLNDVSAVNCAGKSKKTPKSGDTLSSRHVSSHKTYVLFLTPSLFLPMRWLSYADLYNLVTWCHIKRSVGALFQ